MKDLWSNGSSVFQGAHFSMNDCKLSPPPQGDVEIVAAGTSPRGMKFAAEYADYNFIMGDGINTPTAFADNARILVEAGKASGRDVGAYVLFMVIADETDEAAMAKWHKYHDMADMDALKWLIDQSNVDEGRDGTSTAKHMSVPEGAVKFNMGTLVGSYATVARILDEAAAVDGVKGIMLTFDDFLVGMDAFGQKIQPLMDSRSQSSRPPDRPVSPERAWPPSSLMGWACPQDNQTRQHSPHADDRSKPARRHHRPRADA